jgi:uncharacterized membrane protein
MRLDHLPLISVALMVIVSAAAYGFLPPTMTIHWNLMLQPDGLARKQVAVLVLPAIGLVVVAIQLIGRAVASDGTTTVQFSQAALVGLPVLFIAHVGMIAVALASRPGG